MAYSYEEDLESRFSRGLFRIVFSIGIFSFIFCIRLLKLFLHKIFARKYDVVELEHKVSGFIERRFVKKKRSTFFKVFIVLFVFLAPYLLYKSLPKKIRSNITSDIYKIFNIKEKRKEFIKIKGGEPEAFSERKTQKEKRKIDIAIKNREYKKHPKLKIQVHNESDLLTQKRKL